MPEKFNAPMVVRADDKIISHLEMRTSPQEIEGKLQLKMDEYINVLEMRLGSVGWSPTIEHELRQRMRMFRDAMPLPTYLNKVRNLSIIMYTHAQPVANVLDVWVAAEKHVSPIVCRIVATADTVADAIMKFEAFDEEGYLNGIRINAYYIWEASGKTSGHAFKDWLEAEDRTLAFRNVVAPLLSC